MFFRRANKNKGSFLLEALIAVSILSVSLAIIIRSHLTALQAQVFAKDYALATLLLEREMIEVVENGYIERDISQERNLEKPYERFTLFIKTAAAGKEYVFDSLNEVQLTLSWEEGRKAHQFSVSTFIFNSL
ncbi:MAG: hypothetical protein WCX16_04195 [Candidatus Omnitrophota bacterium]